MTAEGTEFETPRLLKVARAQLTAQPSVRQRLLLASSHPVADIPLSARKRNVGLRGTDLGKLPFARHSIRHLFRLV
jgi:hypothetical protein